MSKILGADGRPIEREAVDDVESVRRAYVTSFADAYSYALQISRADAQTRARDPLRNHPWTMAAAVVTALVLTGCAEDGSVSVPEFTLTGDQVQQFLDDARSQAETIGEDVRSLTDDLGSLSGEARTRAEDAVTAAQEAADEARAAADEAATATDDTRAEAEQRLAEAETALEDASTELDERRTAELVRLLGALGAQVLVTTTDPGPLTRILPRSELSLIRVAGGVLDHPRQG